MKPNMKYGYGQWNTLLCCAAVRYQSSSTSFPRPQSHRRECAGGLAAAASSGAATFLVS